MWISWWIRKGQAVSINYSFILCSLQSQINLFTLCFVWPNIEEGFFVLIAKISNTGFPFSKFSSTQFQRTGNKNSVSRTGLTGTLHWNSFSEIRGNQELHFFDYHKAFRCGVSWQAYWSPKWLHWRKEIPHNFSSIFSSHILKGLCQRGRSWFT